MVGGHLLTEFMEGGLHCNGVDRIQRRRWLFGLSPKLGAMFVNQGALAEYRKVMLIASGSVRSENVHMLQQKSSIMPILASLFDLMA